MSFFMTSGTSMHSLWNDADASAMVGSLAAKGVGEDLALRTYSARLLGSNKWLVMHGGGNTSVKTEMTDIHGDRVKVLCVKGSGWDLATIEPAGHPAVRLEPLFRLRGLAALSDEDMVNVQRQNMLDSSGPNPSVETLLHAYLPHKFVDHTHSTTSIAIADQAGAEALGRRIWGKRVGYVPYIMPGFALAKAAADAFDADPSVEGLLLVKHGLFSFGATARESYERIIRLVSEAEDFIARDGKRRIVQGAALASPIAAGDLLPALRGIFAGAAKREGAHAHWVFDHRATDRLMLIANAAELSDLARRGVATPDHVIRTKAFPLVLARPEGDRSAFLADAAARLEAYIADYKAMFARQNARVGGTKKPLDPLPRVVALPGIGFFGLGKTAADAAIVADVTEAWAESLIDAESIGRYEPIGEDDTFDMEYWSLEQAKLGKSSLKRLAGQVVAVTGAGSGIGAATAKAFAAEGAEVALLDLDLEAAGKAAKAAGKTALAAACDVTDPASVKAAIAAVVARFGGLDILVSNAGAAFQGAIATVDEAVMRKSFELNFYGHQRAAQAAVAVMKAQKMGGALLFNVSKQAVNPGRDFGPYGMAKAALLALVRQYALEHGPDGIRSNALNPDRIRSNLLTSEMIASRAKARGVSEAEYMGGNLLGREVTAEDVAQAFLHYALMPATTGDVTTVDGGNVSAMLR
jgi:rhamnose utilization protein RhaD (predicted bifunctional aldolase and dehydrogenase)/NAD(P)-dependent dehydrogenase (short-subunit alcohol dehydrogenase family)